MNAEAVIAANLASLDSVQSALCERRLAHIAELARAVLEACGNEHDGATGFDAIRSAYRAAVPVNEGYGAYAIDKNREDVDRLHTLLSCFDKICLCRALIKLSGNPRVEDFFARDTTLMRNRIAYLRNAYTDIAYRRFAAVLRDPTVTYSDDFTGVCEDVYYGRAGLCILPVENSTEGRLASFGNLIAKYDLKIVLTCRVTTSSSSATRFALLKKNVERIPLQASVPHSDFFELTLTLPEAAPTLSDILYAASCFKLTLCKVDSLPVTYADNEYSYGIIFGTDAAELEGFLYYLTLEAPQFTAVGIYSYLI